MSTTSAPSLSANTIFVTDHTTGYFVNVLPDWLIVILSLECYIVICIDWLYVHFTALCFSHVEVRFDVSVIKELIDWLNCHLKAHIRRSGVHGGAVRPSRTVCVSTVETFLRRAAALIWSVEFSDDRRGPSWCCWWKSVLKSSVF